MKTNTLFVVFLLFSLQFLSACQKSSQPSFLIIGVDSLSSSDLICSSEKRFDSELVDAQSGFKLLCNDSVRFTHAYSTSNQSTSAIASLLTGKYPIDHKVRNASSTLKIDDEVPIATKLALQKQYRTSFFSGGAPVLSKTRLNIGFELFEDSLTPLITKHFRPFEQSVDLFESWLNSQVGKDPFFSFIYVPDLNFTNRPQLDESGQLMRQGFETQLKSFDLTLHRIFNLLKNKGLWNNTNIILAGLNGRPDEYRQNEMYPTNIHSENMHIQLLIKLARKKTDSDMSWKYDNNVSLADVGKTILDLLEYKPTTDLGRVQKNETFPIYSIKNVLLNKNMDQQLNGRSLLIETGWPELLNIGSIRYGIVHNSFLFFYDQNGKLYNSLLDQLETIPLDPEKNLNFPYQKIISELNNENIFPWDGVSAGWAKKLAIPFQYWTLPRYKEELFTQLNLINEEFPNDGSLVSWLAYTALDQKRWKELKKLGQTYKVKTWSYVADTNLNNNTNKSNDFCFNLLFLKNYKPELSKNCEDKTYVNLLKLIHMNSSDSKYESTKLAFERSYFYQSLDFELMKINIALGFPWEVNKTTILEPTLTELALALPQFSKYRPTLLSTQTSTF